MTTKQWPGGGGPWPCADSEELLRCGIAVRSLADEIDRVRERLEDVRSRVPESGSGVLHDVLRAAAGESVRSLSSAVQAVGGLASCLEGYVAAIEDARCELHHLEASLEAERLYAEVVRMLGEPAAVVPTLHTLTAQLDDDLAAIGHEAGQIAVRAAASLASESTDSESTDSESPAGGDAGPSEGQARSSGAGIGVAGGMLGGVGTSLSAAGAGKVRAVYAGGLGPEDTSRLSRQDASLVLQRAQQLQASVPAEVSDSVRLAIGLGRGSDGCLVSVIGTSDPCDYRREGITIAPSERFVGTGAAPELAILAHLREHDLDPLTIATATSPPAEVVSAFDALDAELLYGEAQTHDLETEQECEVVSS